MTKARVPQSMTGQVARLRALDRDIESLLIAQHEAESSLRCAEALQPRVQGESPFIKPEAGQR